MGNWDDYRREERPGLSPGANRVEIGTVGDKGGKAGSPILGAGIQPNGK